MRAVEVGVWGLALAIDRSTIKVDRLIGRYTLTFGLTQLEMTIEDSNSDANGSSIVLHLCRTCISGIGIASFNWICKDLYIYMWAKTKMWYEQCTDIKIPLTDLSIFKFLLWTLVTNVGLDSCKIVAQNQNPSLWLANQNSLLKFLFDLWWLSLNR